MQFYNNTLCISYRELVDGGVIGKSDYQNLSNRKKIQIVCKGGNGRTALIAYDTLPDILKEKVRKVYGENVRELAMSNPLNKWLQKDVKASDFFSLEKLPNGRNIPAEKQYEYTANASVLNAIINCLNDKKTYRKALGGNGKGQSYQAFCDAAQALSGEWGCKLPTSERGLRRVVDGYKKNGYAALISGKLANDNAAKIVENEQHALLRKLLSHANNFDFAQVMLMYNQVADANGWRQVSRKTVENFAAKNSLFTEGGRRGEISFDNTMAMQVKRKGAAYPMLYWTVDGWDAELLYQQTTVKDGKSVTTYHNRPTIVLVLDPHNKYPIGYSIGTHETPELIRAALRNALTHTSELFGGCRYRPNQLQTDRYGNGNLTPFYEAITPRYTPARAKNAKAKVIEPHFNALNKKYCQFMNNWSGFGVTSSKDLQPNTEWKNKIRHSFPDFNGVVAQLEQMIERERMDKRAAYVEGWSKLPDTYKLPWTSEQFLFYAGERKERTTKLRGEGINFQISGAEYDYDSFDIEFRMHQAIDWTIRYDPSDMSNVLATNSDGTVRFFLEQKYIQPMTLVERNEGDSTQLSRISQHNKQMKDVIMQQSATDFNLVDNLLQGTNDTLAKMLLVDSMGQHKNRKNESRAVAAAKVAIEAEKKQENKENQKVLADQSSASDAQYSAYLDKKIDINEFI